MTNDTSQAKKVTGLLDHSSIDQKSAINIQQALADFSNDWPLVPVTQKRPYKANWQTTQFSKAEIQRELDGKADGFGLLLTHQPTWLAVDIDGPSAQKLYAHAAQGQRVDTISWTSGRKGRHQELWIIPDDLVRALQEIGLTYTTFRSWDGVECTGTEHIELRYSNCQSVLPPSKHPDTKKPYTWINSPSTTAIAPAPSWVLAWAWAKVEDYRSTPKVEAKPFTRKHFNGFGPTYGDEPASKVEAALDACSRGYAVDSYEEWYRIGMALHSLDSGLCPLWDRWSQGSPKYQAGECEKKWKSFKGSGVNIATLYHHAKAETPTWWKEWRKEYLPAELPGDTPCVPLPDPDDISTPPPVDTEAPPDTWDIQGFKDQRYAELKGDKEAFHKKIRQMLIDDPNTNLSPSDLSKNTQMRPHDVQKFIKDYHLTKDGQWALDRFAYRFHDEKILSSLNALTITQKGFIDRHRKANVLEEELCYQKANKLQFIDLIKSDPSRHVAGFGYKPGAPRIFLGIPDSQDQPENRWLNLHEPYPVITPRPIEEIQFLIDYYAKHYGEVGAIRNLLFRALTYFRPELKINFAMFLGSKYEGIGKDRLNCPFISTMRGEGINVVASKFLAKDFNDQYLGRTKLLVVNEASHEVNPKKLKAALQDIIAIDGSGKLEVEAKYGKAHFITNVVSVIIQSNAKDSYPITAETKRRVEPYWSEVKPDADTPIISTWLSDPNNHELFLGACKTLLDQRGHEFDLMVPDHTNSHIDAFVEANISTELRDALAALESNNHTMTLADLRAALGQQARGQMPKDIKQGLESRGYTLARSTSKIKGNYQQLIFGSDFTCTEATDIIRGIA